MIHFTADTHFYHANIIKYCKRPYDTVDEMNEALIDNWNSVVGVKDTVYHLGDFSWGNAEVIKTILDKLNGKRKYFIPGNHDNVNHLKRIMNPKYILPGYHVVGFEKKKFCCCHYAMKRWPYRREGGFHLFGHSHGTLIEPELKSLDVGVDCHGYKPISVVKVLEIMK